MLVTLLVWGHTVRFQFVWDDTQFISELQSIRSFKHVPEMFYSLEAQSSYPQGFVLFRPLRTVHYALLYWIPGQNEPQPWIYHLANILWHSLAAVLFFSVLLLLFERQSNTNKTQLGAFAFVTSLGFALQPVVSEVVCWAKSLDDIMATVFTLAATRALLKWDGKNQQYRWALMYFLLAVYSKESAVPFAILVFFILFRFHDLPIRRSVLRTAGFLAIALVFVIHRHLVIGRSSQTAPISGSYGQTLLDMFPVVPKYLRLLCGGPPFFIDYSYLKGHYFPLSMPVIFGALLLVSLAGLMIWTWQRTDLRLIGFGLVWVALFLLPVSNLIPMMQYMAERFLYLPLIGWLVAMGALLIKFQRRILSIGATALIVLIWGCLAWQRSFIWQDPLTLFVRSSQEGPRTPRVEQNAAYAIFQLPQIAALFRLDQIRHRLEPVPGISPEKADRALKTLADARRLFPTEENILNATGMIYAELGQPAEAIGYFLLAIRTNPDGAGYWSNLAIALLDSGQTSKAREAVEKALALEPTQIEALRCASRLYWQTEDFQSAVTVLKKLQQLEPNNQEHAHWIREGEQRLAKSPKA